MNLFLSQRVQYTVNTLKLREVFKSLEGRGAENNLSFRIRFEGFLRGQPNPFGRFLLIVTCLLSLRMTGDEKSGVKSFGSCLRRDPVSIIMELI